MKQLTIIPILIAAFLLAIVKFGFANDNKYAEAMQKNIHAVYTVQTIEELQAAANTFERIGSTEKTKWEPYYYASFGYVMMATRENDATKKDAYLDLAFTALDKAKAIAPNESEVIALEGFNYMIRLTVDPASGGQQYSGLAMGTLGKALALNPENPRGLFFMAQMQYGTAQFFGSPTTEACATLAKSLKKFTTYKSENALAPVWGKEMAEGMKEKCK